MIERHGHFAQIRDREQLRVDVSSATSRMSSRNCGGSGVVVS